MSWNKFKQNISIKLTSTKWNLQEFARDTETIGTERVAAVNEIADQLMGARHSDAATIAEWKDDLNEAWVNFYLIKLL